MSDLISTLAHEAIAELDQSGKRRYLIGITGPPGAGKSTLVEALVRACGQELGLQQVIGLPMDGFHLTNRRLVELGLQQRKGAPDTFDAGEFVSGLRQLADQGASTLRWPGYSRQLHEPVADALTIPEAVQLAFVEGNYLLLEDPPWDAIGEIIDSIWYVAADMDTIQSRLHLRQLDAGRKPADADAHVVQSDMVNAARIEETRGRADRVVHISATDPLLSGLRDPATGRLIVPD